MNLQTLLVPLDGSRTAEAALPFATTIGRATGASLALLAVVEEAPIRTLVEHGRMETLAGAEQKAMSPADDYLAVCAAALTDQGLRATTRVIAGDPAEAILAVADELEAGCIVMATHGRGGLQRWIVGSVADKVMRTSARPVLLVRPPAEDGHAGLVPIRRIVVPLDGSAPAEAALPPAAELARALGATIVLVRVEQPAQAAMTMYDPIGYIPDLSGLDEQIADEALKYLQQMQSKIPAEVPSDVMLLRGAPATTLLEVLSNDPADLVIMTTHGRGGLRRLVLGSTADRLVRAGVPVLLIRPATPVPEPMRGAMEPANAGAPGRLDTR
jgi:nucleotide-binding universal stress UspA family protein